MITWALATGGLEEGTRSHNGGISKTGGGAADTCNRSSALDDEQFGHRAAGIRLSVASEAPISPFLASNQWDDEVRSSESSRCSQ